VTGEAVRLALLDGEPRVMLDDMAVTANSLQVDPFGLQPGEADQVGRAIAFVLAAPVAAEPPAPPKADISGVWEVEVAFLKGERSHRIELRQDGGAVTGNHRSPQFEGSVSGAVDNDSIDLMFTTWYEGAMIAYRLTGSAAGGRMQGDVTLGSATANRLGAINLAQFGSGRFHGVRV
jgi:hypothetical protein